MSRGLRRSWWRRVTEEPVAARGTLVIWGVLHIAVLLGLQPPYIYADLLQSAPWLSETLFWAAAVACFAYALKPRSMTFEIVSLSLCLMAAASRFMLLVFYAEWIPYLSFSIPPPPAFGWALILVAELFMWPHLMAAVRRRGDD